MNKKYKNIFLKLPNLDQPIINIKKIVVSKKLSLTALPLKYKINLPVLVKLFSK